MTRLRMGETAAFYDRMMSQQRRQSKEGQFDAATGEDRLSSLTAINRSNKTPHRARKVNPPVPFNRRPVDMSPPSTNLTQLPSLLTKITDSETGSAGRSPAFRARLERTVRTAHQNLSLRNNAISAFIEKAQIDGLADDQRASIASMARMERRTCISLIKMIGALQGSSEDQVETTICTVPTVPDGLSSLPALVIDEVRILGDMKARVEMLEQNLKASSEEDRVEEVWSFGFDRLQSCLDLEQLRTEIEALSVPEAGDDSEDDEMPNLESPREVILGRAVTASTDFLAKLAEKTEKDWEGFTEDQLKWQRLLDKSNTGVDVWSELE